MKLMRKLRGRDVRITHGLAESLEQLEREPPAFARRSPTFIDGLVSHYVLDDGKLVVAHAGLPRMQGRGSARVRDFALYGDTTGETDEYGLPVRYPWAEDIAGRAMVVYGHTPGPRAEWVNGTICIDTGCVFGGSLTALAIPSASWSRFRRPRPTTSRQAARPRRRPRRRCRPSRRTTMCSTSTTCSASASSRRASADTVTIREENAAAALEVMSRFAVDPQWLVYLPPTMSPAETSSGPTASSIPPKRSQ